MWTGSGRRESGVIEVPVYPAAGADRDRFVLALRPRRRMHDPWRHQGVLVEEERTGDGSAARVATIFLTGRECPWRCAMCDLWTFTIEQDTPRGALVQQVLDARGALETPLPEGVKLYNAGSFFDPRAVPVGDYDAIARELQGLDRVIVESHPSLVGGKVEWLLASLERQRPADRPAVALEVAMGLETAHPEALERLNKRMTLEAFAAAARRLRASGVAVRAFLLISPPFVPAEEQDDWLVRSIDAAVSCGASAISLVPTRPGNGVLERLAERQMFFPPGLADVERSLLLALTHTRGRARVFADLWDIEQRAACRQCVGARRERLHRMNLSQQALDAVACGCCGLGTAG